MFQKALLNELAHALPAKTSLIEAVATALDISYDAAHRRTSLKSKFSLDESVAIAKYYNLSLDKLFGLTASEYISVQKTPEIRSMSDLEHYFETSTNSLKQIATEDAHILYSAKDIPIFYTLNDSLLTRFKLYAWLKILDPSFGQKSFETFAPSTTLIEKAKQLGKQYEKFSCSEIWDITTINSTLKQIHFYHEAGLLAASNAITICNELNDLIYSIKTKITSKNDHYQFYYNELLLMNNNVLVRSGNTKALYTPFTILSYYLATDKTTCEQAEDHLLKRLAASKLLNTAGEKEQNTFFNKMEQKITALLTLISSKETLDFQ